MGFLIISGVNILGTIFNFAGQLSVLIIYCPVAWWLRFGEKGAFTLCHGMCCFRFRTEKVHGQSFSLVTISGDEYIFISPNADTITRMLQFFLNGLRLRSNWAIALEDFHLEGEWRHSLGVRFKKKLTCFKGLIHKIAYGPSDFLGGQRHWQHSK